MAEPKNSNYGGWFKDLENGTLDIYYGEGGASDPVEIARVDTSGMTVVTGDLNVSAGNISLAAGTLDIEDGGAVTQATNRTTGVTNSNYSGKVTTTATSLAAVTIVTHTVTNTLVAASDNVIVTKVSGDADTSCFVSAVGAGSFDVSIRNNHASSADTTAFVYNFAVIKSSIG